MPKFNFLDKFLNWISIKNVSEGICATKYPILLLHGLGYWDDMFISSWGFVPDYLKQSGAQVFFGNLDGVVPYEENAKKLVERVNEILDETKAGKVNIIAHSKGGIESRFAISMLGMGDSVASLTTISSPHYGSPVADIVNGFIKEDNDIVYKLIDWFAEIMGDKNPKGSKAIEELTISNMKKFNEKVKDHPSVYYQSYGARMKNISDDLIFALTYPLILKHEGENDGMVSTQSCRWGEFKGIIDGGEKSTGMSHLQITGSIKNKISGVDIPMFYVSIAEELKNKNF